MSLALCPDRILVTDTGSRCGKSIRKHIIMFYENIGIFPLWVNDSANIQYVYHFQQSLVINNEEIYYVTTHYDVIYYILHR